jgi:hypothetical protein
MRGSKDRDSVRAKQRIPRIPARKAAEILKQCDKLLADSKQVLADLPRAGFAQFLALLSEDILHLAIQPDSRGEHARARLISHIVPALQGNMAERNAVSLEDIAYCSNIVMPCLLLELGRRKRHIEIQFPPDPTGLISPLQDMRRKTLPISLDYQPAGTATCFAMRRGTGRSLLFRRPKESEMD